MAIFSDFEVPFIIELFFQLVRKGTKSFISGGSSSGIYLIMTRTGDQNSGAKGISVNKIFKKFKL